MNKIKTFFNRAKSFPIYKKKTNIKIEEEIMVLVKLRANYCSTCEEMIFQTLKKCKNCKKRKICVFCSEENDICKECDDELMAVYDNIEKDMKKSIKYSFGSDKEIEDCVDQLL